MGSVCLSCGHDQADHDFFPGSRCRLPGCACPKFEQTGPATATAPTGAVAGPPVLCKCGHDLAAHSGSGIGGVPCKICGATSKGLPTGNCMGWDSTGATAGPPDLGQAIQAAGDAIHARNLHSVENASTDCTCYVAGQIAVESAAPVLLQATRDRLAEVEVQVAELHDLLRQMFDHRGGQIEDNGLDDWDPNYKWWVKDTPLTTKVRAALDLGAAQEEDRG